MNTYKVRVKWTDPRHAGRWAETEIEAGSPEEAEAEAMGCNGEWMLEGETLAVMPLPDDAVVI